MSHRINETELIFRHIGKGGRKAGVPLLRKDNEALASQPSRLQVQKHIFMCFFCLPLLEISPVCPDMAFYCRPSISSLWSNKVWNATFNQHKRHSNSVSLVATITAPIVPRYTYDPYKKL